MRQVELSQFGVEHLEVMERPVPEPGPGEIRVRFQAASLNPRDFQIISGVFTPNVPFPLVPLSDGAGVVDAVGEGVTRFAAGDLVTPLFFPNWHSGEALADERAVSSGLETPGTAREYGIYSEEAVSRAPDHLAPAEAACYPCAGLTAWTSLVDRSAVGPGDWVLVQGTGGVATMSLQLAKALGASVIVLSSSDEKLERAAALGADETINYGNTPEWGQLAFEMSGHGVDAVIEIGGAGTLPQSLAAIRHGGHINIIGYMAGVQMDITVFPLIIRNANLHGVGTGNRDSYESLMRFLAEHHLHPVIAESLPLEDIRAGFAALETGSPFGKVVLTF